MTTATAKLRLCDSCGCHPARSGGCECYSCHNRRYRNNPAVKAARARANKKYRRTSRLTLQGWAASILVVVKKRARNQGVPFLLTKDDIIRATPLDGHCPALGIMLTFGPTTPSHASVDRIVPERGYVPSNIRVISIKANRIKNRRTAEQMEAHANDCKRIAEYIRRELTESAPAA